MTLYQNKNVELANAILEKTLLQLDKHLIILLHVNAVHEGEATLHEIYNKLMWFEIVYVWEEWQGIREREIGRKREEDERERGMESNKTLARTSYFSIHTSHEIDE